MATYFISPFFLPFQTCFILHFFFHIFVSHILTLFLISFFVTILSLMSSIKPFIHLFFFSCTVISSTTLSINIFPSLLKMCCKYFCCPFIILAFILRRYSYLSPQCCCNARNLQVLYSPPHPLNQFSMKRKLLNSLYSINYIHLQLKSNSIS